jgi:hypothetical protein
MELQPLPPGGKLEHLFTETLIQETLVNSLYIASQVLNLESLNDMSAKLKPLIC